MPRLTISTEMYHKLASKQNYACAICGKLEWDCPRKRLYVDHNHRTGEIRSLLCGQCNTALGMVKENPRIAGGLLGYIKRWN